MSRKPTRHPTQAELAILQILWDCGPCTVRQVHNALNRATPTGYTTALKFLQIMVKKKIIARDENAHPHTYRPVLSRGRAQQQLVKDLLERAFAGSAKGLVMQALTVKKATPEELKEIEKILSKFEKEAP